MICIYKLSTNVYNVAWLAEKVKVMSCLTKILTNNKFNHKITALKTKYPELKKPCFFKRKVK